VPRTLSTQVSGCELQVLVASATALGPSAPTQGHQYTRLSRLRELQIEAEHPQSCFHSDSDGAGDNIEDAMCDDVVSVDLTDLPTGLQTLKVRETCASAAACKRCTDMLCNSCTVFRSQCRSSNRRANDLNPNRNPNPETPNAALTETPNAALTAQRRRYPQLFMAAGGDLRAFYQQSPISVAAFVRECYNACNAIATASTDQ